MVDVENQIFWFLHWKFNSSKYPVEAVQIDLYSFWKRKILPHHGLDFYGEALHRNLRDVQANKKEISNVLIDSSKSI